MLPACPACGRPVELPDAATVETMPHCLRESHRAARNSGVYPLNGATRDLAHPRCASTMVADDPDWTRIVAGEARR